MTLAASSLTAAPAGLPGTLRIGTLENGLRLSVLERRGAPIVATALWLPAGTRDERAGDEGAAHLLEHMMFKGSPHFGPGEIDRLTQRLGGHSNAYTSHDATVYTFAFERGVWSTALEIEADRLRGPTLDPNELASERRVVLEELSMYENEPWDALEQDVYRALFPDHPYGRPILGTRESLSAITGSELEQFFRTHYRMDTALLAIAGDVDWHEVKAVADGTIGRLPAPPVASVQRPVLPAASPAERLEIERPPGQIERRSIAFATVPATDPAHGALRLLTWVLAGGRSSRLQAELVEERKLCAWVSADLADAQGPSVLSIAFEASGPAHAARAEDTLWRSLDELSLEPIADAELARSKRMALAEWVFTHESAAALAQAIGSERALFAPGHTESALRALLGTSSADLAEAARQLLEYRCVIGRSRSR